MVKNIKDIEDIAIIYSTTPGEAKEMANGIAGFPREKIYVEQLGPVVATHAGPGVLGIAIRTKN
jgi:fatty acid-binding protein DegV